MFDEIAPVLAPAKRVKSLAAEPEKLVSLPAIDSVVSFAPFINYLKENKPQDLLPSCVAISCFNPKNVNKIWMKIFSLAKNLFNIVLGNLISLTY